MSHNAKFSPLDGYVVKASISQVIKHKHREARIDIRRRERRIVRQDLRDPIPYMID